jgi:GTP:adenosylcobinamide-phosphate guanylyltransferase
LRDNQIAYNRYGDGLSGSWDAVVNFYRKGYKEDIDLVVANNGDPVIAASVAIEAFNALKVGNVHAALEALARYQKYVVPELPPFQLVDGVP